jgi:hypothetical protein
MLSPYKNMPNTDIRICSFVSLSIHSGTTVLACKSLGLNWLGIEKDERCFPMIEKKLSQSLLNFDSKMNDRTVEPSDLSEVKEHSLEDNHLGRAKPQTCPYGKEYGYEGVFMWTRLFD